MYVARNTSIDNIGQDLQMELDEIPALVVRVENLPMFAPIELEVVCHKDKLDKSESEHG